MQNLDNLFNFWPLGGLFYGYYIPKRKNELIQNIFCDLFQFFSSTFCFDFE